MRTTYTLCCSSHKNKINLVVPFIRTTYSKSCCSFFIITEILVFHFLEEHKSCCSFFYNNINLVVSFVEQDKSCCSIYQTT